MNPVRNTKAISEGSKISNGMNPVRNTKAISEGSKISNGMNPVRTYCLSGIKGGLTG